MVPEGPVGAGRVATSAAGAGTKMLIIGSSMVRHVRVHGAVTRSISGATVNDVHCSLLRRLRDDPCLTTVVIHAGANDLRFGPGYLSERERSACGAERVRVFPLFWS